MPARVTASTWARAALVALTAGTVAVALGAGDSRAGGTVRPQVTITMGDFSYTPGTVTVKPGQTVRFLNRGKIEHTVADVTRTGAILGARIKPRLLARGQSQAVTFSRPGTILYLCTLHPTLMKGKIVVSPSGVS